MPSQMEARSDVLISSEAVLERGIFFLDERNWTIGKKLTEWRLSRHPGRISQSASISFLHSIRSLYSFCDINITRSSLIVKLVYWPKYGHTLFNVISNIYQTLNEMKVEFGHIRLYAAVDDKNALKNSNQQILDLGHYASIFKALSNEPVYNYHALIKSSLSRTICFTNLIALGVSKRLDHYTPRIPLENWQRFSKWILNVFHLSTTARNSDASLVEKQIVLTMIERSQRKIINLAQLKTIAEKTYGHAIVVQIIDLADIPFSDQLRFMRNTTILLGIDGTGLMNSLFMLNPCGVVIHIGTYMMRVLVPGKGGNFRPLAEAGTAKNRYIYSEIRNLIDVSVAQRDRFRRIPIGNMTRDQRYHLVKNQDIRLPPSQYLELMEKAMNMTQICLDRLAQTNSTNKL